MNIVKKTLHLNYSEQKGEKIVHKGYAFNINNDVDPAVAKEVGDELAKLFAKTIEGCTLNIKESL